MSYYYNGNYNASSAQGGNTVRGGQGNGIAPATHGHSVEHPQPLHQHAYQQPPVLHQWPQAPDPRATLSPARAPPAPPIHFVLDRQYTLCNAPSLPPQPAPPHQYVPVPASHYTAAPPVPQYTPARNVPHYTPPRDGAHYAPTPSNGPRYVPPALRDAARYTPAHSGAHYTPAPAPPSHTPYAPAAAPALVPFRCAHPQCAGRVVMVPSAREHMWAAHSVRV